MPGNAAAPSHRSRTPLPEDAVRRAFLQRSVAALERIAAQADPGRLADALAAPSDVGTIARALGDPRAVGDAVASLDPLSDALARGATAKRDLVEVAGGALGAEEAGRLLGITRQAVDKRRRAGALLAVRIGDDWRYPACQFDEAGPGGVVAGLPEVVQAMAAAGPWATLDVLLAADGALGGASPLAVLRSGGGEGLAAVRRLLRQAETDAFG
jgi:hypothetical protein